ncbi:2,3-dihydro-2,3-dihydroxybenzoate dehydrogenase [Pseudoalteromonas arctica]|nr:2,3-dihydro-2,3-dihydroxybenzoate dehydrogenase [Pseudoalteromonas arctica]
MMNQQQSKKIAWVTGVNQGIGAAIFQRFHEQGMQVVGFDISKRNVPEQLKPFVYECDVKRSSHVDELCQQLLVSSPPDYFVSVAGVLEVNKIAQATIAQWHNTFAVNLFGPVYFMRWLTPHFQQRRAGSIVFVSSNAARVPRVGMAAYGASKAALTNMAKTLALELAPYSVRVNSVSPGSTFTSMQTDMWVNGGSEQRTIAGDMENYKLGIPLQKLATTADIADAVTFLTSEQAGHITMHDLVVDGGATLGG